MKIIFKNDSLYKVFLLLIMLQSLVASEDVKNKIVVQNDFALQYNEITGAGKSKSSLSDGLKYYDMFNISSKGTYDDMKYKVALGLKATDDKKKDINTFSITNIQGMLKNKSFTLRMGDVYESFSQYSLNTALKGASYRYANSTKSNQVQLIYGVAVPRWDSFWSNNTKSIKRNVYGVRYKNKQVDSGLQTGVSFVYSKDEDRVFTNDILYENMLYTLDTQYTPIRGLVLSGEFSHSDNTKDSSKMTKNEQFSGNAIKVRAEGNQNPSRVVIEYERVSPGFITLTGAATQDREKVKSTWRYKYSKKLTTHLGFLWYKNNLNSQLAYGKNVYRPSVGLTYKKLLDRRYNVIDVKYKYEKINTKNDVTNHMVDLSVSDKFGAVHNTTNLAYYIYYTDNALVDNHEIRANTKFSGRITRDGYTLKPYVSLGTWSNKDELQTSLDKYYEGALGLGINIPKYKLSSLIKIGENTTNRELVDDSRKIFFSASAYYKPKKVLFFDRTLFYAKVLYNDFSYGTTLNNYREQGVSVGMTVKF